MDQTRLYLTHFTVTTMGFFMQKLRNNWGTAAGRDVSLRAEWSTDFVCGDSFPSHHILAQGCQFR